MSFINGRRYGNDNEIGLPEMSRIIRYNEERGGSKFLGRYFTTRISVAAIALDLLLRQVKSDRFALLAKLDGQRQSHVP
jgi:hypothetical protein